MSSTLFMKPAPMSPENDSKRLSFESRDSQSSDGEPRRSLFKSLSSKTYETVQVVNPANIAVEYIHGKAGIVDPEERRRIARREQRRYRSKFLRH